MLRHSRLIYRLGGAVVTDKSRRKTYRSQSSPRSRTLAYSLPFNVSTSTLSVFGVVQLGRKADRRARRAELKFCVWFLWGNRNKLWGLRAKFWRGPSYHAKGCFQGYQYVILSSIVRLRAFLCHKTVLPPSHGSIRCIIAEKHWICHFSRKPEVEIWRKHAQSTFCTRLPIRLQYQ